MRLELQQELDKYKNCDPQAIEQLQKETLTATDAVNRWTGKGQSNNVYTVEIYMGIKQ